MVGERLRLMERETGLDVGALTTDVTFMQLDVGSLVLSEESGTVLSVEIRSSRFIECPIIGDTKARLE
jgi:hypothetical protein